MASHPTPDQLAAFDLGHLRAGELAEIERHVAGCAQCCQELESLPDDQLVKLVRQSASRGGDTIDQLAGSTGMSAPVLPEVPAELIDHPRYRVLELLGAGGMGVVFKAEHRLMERTVALKVIAHKLVDNPAGVERFRQEVKTAARLAHPNIVTAYDAEQAGDIHFLVMEFIEGSSLDRVLNQRGPLPVAEACVLVQQAAQGLQYAHEKGMVHRDIKPGNLMVSSRHTPCAVRGVGHDGSIRETTATAHGVCLLQILDFGLARFVSETMPVEALTASGMLVGTPDYVAPEQALDPRQADIRADIYSLGCTLYHLLTGKPPFPGGTVMQKLIAHREQLVQPIEAIRPDVPAALRRILDRMLAKEPAQRFQTPAEVVLALAPFSQPADLPAPSPPVSSRRERLRTWAGLLAGCGLLAAVVAIFLLDVFVPVAQTPIAGLGPGPDMSQPPPAASAPLTIQQLRKEARNQAVAWLRENNSGGPKSSFVAERTKYIDDAQAQGQDIVLGLGSRLVKSRRPAYLVIRAGQFFAFDWTAMQNPDPKLAVNSALGVLRNHDTLARVLPAPVRLSDLKIDDAAAFPADRDLSGSVVYRSDKTINGSVGLLITYYWAGQRVLRTHRLRHDLGPGPGMLTFSVGSVGKGGQDPLFVFVELCMLGNPDQAEPPTVQSNAVAAMVVVIPPATE